MSLLFAAIGATVTALLETTLGPYLTVGNANVHPVLVVAVIWTIAAGIDSGIVFGFVGGLVLDILLGRPLGRRRLRCSSLSAERLSSPIRSLASERWHRSSPSRSSASSIPC